MSRCERNRAGDTRSNGVNAELKVMEKAIEQTKELLDGFAETRKQVISAQFYEHICAVAVLTEVDSATARAIHLDIAPGTVNSEAAQRVFGAIRPVVGAVFGAVVFLAVFSGMVPLELPAPSGDLFSFAAFGFAAGFSERLAKDTLSRVESTIPPSSAAAHAGTPTERLLP